MDTARALPWVPIAVSLLAGMFAGASIAMIPLTLNYHSVLSDCSRITGQGARFVHECEVFRQCVAYASSSEGERQQALLCVHRDMLGRTPAGTCRNQSATKAGCGSDGAPCAWDADDGECRHSPGWTPFDVSIFATGTAFFDPAFAVTPWVITGSVPRTRRLGLGHRRRRCSSVRP